MTASDAPARDRAPATVRVTIGLLAVVSVFTLFNLATAIWDMATWERYLRPAAAAMHATPAQVASARSTEMSGDTFAIVVFVLFALCATAGVVLCARRSRIGPIVAAVGAFPMVVCGLVETVPSHVTGLMAAADDRQPALIGLLGYIALVGLVPLALVIVILLLSPSSRIWFRRLPPAPPGYMYVRIPPNARIHPSGGSGPDPRR